MIPIYSTPISDWQELQIRTAKIFSDMGYKTEIEADIQTARGIVNVDVLATKGSIALREIYLSECKFWNTPVSKTVVHSFRAVVSDYGANAGFLISHIGFQSGSIKAAKNSNIYLMTFDEFQTEFRTQWLDIVIDDLAQIVYPLRRYCDFGESFFKKEFEALSPEKKETYWSFLRKYDTLSMQANAGLFKDMITRKLDFEWIDHSVTEKTVQLFGKDQVPSLMAYFDYMKNFCEQGVSDFDNLFGKKLRKR